MTNIPNSDNTAKHDYLNPSVKVGALHRTLHTHQDIAHAPSQIDPLLTNTSHDYSVTGTQTEVQSLNYKIPCRSIHTSQLTSYHTTQNAGIHITKTPHYHTSKKAKDTYKNLKYTSCNENPTQREPTMENTRRYTLQDDISQLKQRYAHPIPCNTPPSPSQAVTPIANIAATRATSHKDANPHPAPQPR